VQYYPLLAEPVEADWDTSQTCEWHKDAQTNKQTNKHKAQG